MLDVTDEPQGVSGPEHELLSAIQAANPRFRDIQALSDGRVFLTARAFDKTAEKDVLLTVARPADSDARRQLTILRKLMVHVSDERIGTVSDRLWQREARDGWACLVSTFHPGLRTI